MQLEQLTLDVRPRSNWQAIDLGLVLLRAHWKLIYTAWWVIWLPLALIVALIPGMLESGWAVLIVWLCKPLVERLPVYILGRAVFGATPGLRATLRDWPSQLRYGLVGGLTWRRFTQVGRAFYTPVLQLEGLHGKAARQRWAVLSGHGAGGTASWFAALCANAETLLATNVVLLLGAFTPDIRGFNPFRYFSLPGNGHELMQILLYAGTVVGGGVIGPWYVASCFALYLNRRSTLEGWDLELGLRQMQQRLEQLAPVTVARATRTVASKLALALVGSALLAAVGFAPTPSWAITPIEQAALPAPDAHRPLAASPQQAAVRAKIDAALNGPDFHHWTEESSWVYKPDPSTAPVKPTVIKPISEAVANFIKWAIIGMAVALVLWVLYRYRALLPALPKRTEAKARMPTHVAGMEIAPDSLPANVAAEVQRLWRLGEQRAALALLYRATLAALVQRYALALRASHTENDCLALARKSLPGEAGSGFAQITAAWQAGAWGNRWPTQVDDLCAAWQRHFTLEAPL